MKTPFTTWYQDSRIPTPTVPGQGLEVPLPPNPDAVSPDSELFEGTDPNAIPDVAFNHPLARKARRIIALGDLQGLDNFYRLHRGDDATLILDAVALNNNYSQLLENWGMRETNSATAQLFAGTNFSWRAWEARGGRLANEVSGGQWNVFLTFLEEAQKHLLKAINLRPDDAEPYYRMIKVLLGIKGATPEAQNYLDRVRERHPDHLSAHMAALTHTCEKWGGSHAQMFQFAQRYTQNAAIGSPLWALIPMAILERSVYYMIEEDYDGANAFLKSDDVVNQVYDAYKNSAGSDRMVTTCLSPVVHNWFACNMIYSNLKLAKEALTKVGAQITERPWAYIDVPVYGHVNRLRKDYKLPPI